MFPRLFSVRNGGQRTVVNLRYFDPGPGLRMGVYFDYLESKNDPNLEVCITVYPVFCDIVL